MRAFSDKELVEIRDSAVGVPPQTVQQLAEVLLAAKRRLAAVAGSVPHYGGFGDQADRLRAQRERQVAPIRAFFPPDEQGGL